MNDFIHLMSSQFFVPNSRYRKGVIAEVPVQEAPCHDLPTIGWSNPDFCLPQNPKNFVVLLQPTFQQLPI